MSFHVPEVCRVLDGAQASDSSCGNNGLFSLSRLSALPRRTSTFDIAGLRVIASDGGDWDHVSVSRADRIPSWMEMCYVRNLFWDPEDCVIQLHPPASQYVNCHPYCLHVWRPQRVSIPQPPAIFVGPQQ